MLICFSFNSFSIICTCFVLTGISRWLDGHTIISLSTLYIKVPLRIISCCNLQSLRICTSYTTIIDYEWLHFSGLMECRYDGGWRSVFIPIADNGAWRMSKFKWPIRKFAPSTLISWEISCSSMSSFVHPYVPPFIQRAEAESRINDAGVVECYDALTFNAIRNVEFNSLSIQNTYLCIRIRQLRRATSWYRDYTLELYLIR